MFRNIRHAMVFGGTVVFTNETEAFTLDDSMTYDAAPEAGGQPTAIPAVWESGFMSFGADFRRKYSSEIFLSIRPDTRSEIIVTAQTDKRDNYIEKTVFNNVLDFSNISFSEWTFNTSTRPTINRVRLKVKKFIYYKLIFRIDKPGSRGTILAVDQKVRYGAMAK